MTSERFSQCELVRKDRAMGDPVGEAERAIRRAIDATGRATTALESFADHETAASVEMAVAAARFSLTEALRRVGR
jgi:hypothetical protein